MPNFVDPFTGHIVTLDGRTCSGYPIQEEALLPLGGRIPSGRNIQQEYVGLHIKNVVDDASFQAIATQRFVVNTLSGGVEAFLRVLAWLRLQVYSKNGTYGASRLIFLKQPPPWVEVFFSVLAWSRLQV